MTYFSPIWVFTKTVGRIVCANCGIKCQACDHRFNKYKRCYYCGNNVSIKKQ